MLKKAAKKKSSFLSPIEALKGLFYFNTPPTQETDFGQFWYELDSPQKAEEFGNKVYNLLLQIEKEMILKDNKISDLEREEATTLELLPTTETIIDSPSNLPLADVIYIIEESAPTEDVNLDVVDIGREILYYLIEKGVTQLKLQAIDRGLDNPQILMFLPRM